MLFSEKGLGIVVSRTKKLITIFDTECMRTIQTIPVGADVLDVAINSDYSRAAISSQISKTIFQLDLTGKFAKIIGSATTTTYLEDISMSPDGRFALCVDGLSNRQNIVSYSLEQNSFISILPSDGLAVAVSPNGNGLILTAERYPDRVHAYLLARDGSIIDTGLTFPTGPNPNNINFSRDGNFAFIPNYFNSGLSVLSTAHPDQISLLSTLGTESNLSMAISIDGRHLFVLGSRLVSIYLFDPVSGSLYLERSFEHGLPVVAFYGVDQIALDPSEERIFISAEFQVGVFTTQGISLGTVEGATGPGGIKICS